MSHYEPSHHTHFDIENVYMSDDNVLEDSIDMKHERFYRGMYDNLKDDGENTFNSKVRDSFKLAIIMAYYVLSIFTTIGCMLAYSYIIQIMVEQKMYAPLIVIVLRDVVYGLRLTVDIKRLYQKYISHKKKKM